MKVTVGGNSDENLIVFGDRVLWKLFLDNLVEVDLHCVVVPFERRIHLMQESFALEEDGPAHSRHNIHNTSGSCALSVEAQTSHFGRG